MSVSLFCEETVQKNDCSNWDLNLSSIVPKDDFQTNCLTWSEINFGLNCDEVNGECGTIDRASTICAVTIGVDEHFHNDTQMTLFKVMFDDSEQRTESIKASILEAIRKNTWIYTFPENSHRDEIINGSLRAWFFLMSEGTDIMFTVAENLKHLHWVPVFHPTWKK